MKPLVSIKKCSSYEREELASSIEKLLAPLGGMSSFVKPGDRVLIKPNLLKAAPPEKAVTTHPALVEAITREIQKAGGTVTIGDSPGIGKMEKILAETGMTEVAKNTGASLTELKDSMEIKTPEGCTFQSLELAREAMEADKIINLPKIKTHAQMYVTLGVKNCFGCVVGKRKPQWHFKAGTTREQFAGLILDIYLTVKPVLTIADGILAMEGNGPGSGEPKQTGLLAASSDALAMDRAIVDILGLDPEEVPLFKAARERGLPGTELEEIEISGDYPGTIEVENFRPAKIIDMMFGPPFLQKHFKKALTARPDVNHELCTLCGDCIKTCPVEVMSVKKKQLDIFYDECIRCFCCQEVCPEGAITPKQGWLLKLLSKND